MADYHAFVKAGKILASGSRRALRENRNLGYDDAILARVTTKKNSSDPAVIEDMRGNTLFRAGRWTARGLAA